MVDFTLTDEQKALREMAHDFAVKEIRPVAWEYDKDGTWPAGHHREGLGGRPDELATSRRSTAAPAPATSTAA